MKMRILITLATLAFLAGCQITNKKAKVTLINPIDTKPKDFVLIGDREYQAELTASLSKHGFNLKPIATQQQVTELEKPQKVVKYNEAGTRYAIELNVKHHYGNSCVFSDNHVVDVVMSVIDIKENNTILIIKQSGPDGVCPPLTPVWDLLATELAKNWKTN